MRARLAELPYRADSALLFSRVQDRIWSLFLDSVHPHSPTGRYDVIAAEPFITLETRAGETRIRRRGGLQRSRQEPFALLRETLEALGERQDNPQGLPFCGGAIGYFAYDLGRPAAGLAAERRQAGLALPDMAVGIYDWVVLVDHQDKRCLLVGAGRDAATAERWTRLVRRFSEAGAGPESGPESRPESGPGNTGAAGRPATPQQPGRVHAPQQGAPDHTGAGASPATLESDMSEEYYFSAFQRIQEYIRQGDCYQVNLAQRFQLRCAEDPWLLYRGLRLYNPAPFSAFLRLAEGAVLSLSPESFLQLRGGRVTTRPVKGTRMRSPSPREDRRLAEALQGSSKDRAENLMIVDLLRNDLSRSCIPGSVTVPQLYQLESYRSVHHLVSTIRGQLRPDQHALDLLRACFPGGSITGAPKRRAMEIIDELEPHGRGVYCGSVAHIGFNGDMSSNIAIRTLVQHRGRLYCWGGGGIVSDSKAEDEYQECFDKLAAIMRFFATGAAGAAGADGPE